MMRPASTSEVCAGIPWTAGAIWAETHSGDTSRISHGPLGPWRVTVVWPAVIEAGQEAVIARVEGLTLLVEAE